MSKITILSENLANQIAAGEVVERPASVVKELVENSIDSGATSITLQVEGGGTRLLRIVDDGSGMDQDDLLLCLERHATSKLYTPEQLSDIQTLGFRGEAIPSIASVSKLTITSRLTGQPLGNRVEVQYGAVKKIHEMGCSHGTMVEVKNLFGNVPARRKFLKTSQTEISHIDETFKAHALCSHHLSFTYQVNGKIVYELNGQGDSSLHRVRQVLGYDADLISLSSQEKGSDSSAIKISGFLVPPDKTTGKSIKLWIFVNGRNVSDRMVNHAVLEGLQGFIMKGRRAAGVIFIKVPPGSVDVNVHPNKQEVRFHQSNLVHKAVAQAVQQGLDCYQEQLKYQIFGRPKSLQSSEPNNGDGNYSEKKTVLPRVVMKPVESGCVEKAPLQVNLRPDYAASKERTPGPKIDRSASRDNVEPSEKVNKVGTNGDEEIDKLYQAPISSFPDQKDGSLDQSAMDLRCIGQLHGTYILCESENGMFAIDQHAAQERLLFADLKKQYGKLAMPSQVLMFPQMVELSSAECEVMEQHGTEIGKLGIDIQAFGGESYVIKAVPVILSHLAPDEILLSILRQFAASDGVTHSVLLEKILADMACKASIKAGHVLKSNEVESLLKQMKEAGVFSHCPHGRPVVKHFSTRDIQNWFLRS